MKAFDSNRRHKVCYILTKVDERMCLHIYFIKFTISIKNELSVECHTTMKCPLLPPQPQTINFVNLTGPFS